MNESLDTLQQAAEQSIAAATDLRALEQCRVEWLGKKGRITEQLKQLAQLTGYEKGLRREGEPHQAGGDCADRVTSVRAGRRRARSPNCSRAH